MLTVSNKQNFYKNSHFNKTSKPVYFSSTKGDRPIMPVPVDLVQDPILLALELGRQTLPPKAKELANEGSPCGQYYVENNAQLGLPPSNNPAQTFYGATVAMQNGETVEGSMVVYQRDTIIRNAMDISEKRGISLPDALVGLAREVVIHENTHTLSRGLSLGKDKSVLANNRFMQLATAEDLRHIPEEIFLADENFAHQFGNGIEQATDEATAYSNTSIKGAATPGTEFLSRKLFPRNRAMTQKLCELFDI